MSQPPPDQDRPPGIKPSIWPSGNEPPAWPSPGQTSSWPGNSQAAPWPRDDRPSAGEPSSPAWPPAGQPPLSGPAYSDGYRRRPSWRPGRIPVRAIIVLGLVIALGLAVRDLTGHHKAATVAPSAPPGAGLHTGLQAPPGPVGASFTLDDGGGNSYQVALVKVIDPAHSANPAHGAQQAGGRRFVGLVFRIRALAGSLPGEDADNDAVLAGTDGHDYQADLTPLAGYAGFDHGVIRLAPGQTATGAVAFQLPDGVRASQVQWTALSGFGSLVEWNVGG